MKEKLINDLHKVLFCTQMESDPDNWDLVVAMAKAVISHHGLHFKEASEIEDSRFWSNNDVEAHFFDTACPGRVPSVTQFEAICSQHFDFEMWQQVKSITRPFDDIFKQLGNILKPTKAE